MTFTAGEREGDSYTGDFVNNRFHGKGKYTFKSGKNQVSYEGDFREG